MRTRKLFINQGMLEQMLGVPRPGRVLHIGTTLDPHGIEVIVEHPDYDEVPEYTESPRVPADVTVTKFLDRGLGQVVGVPYYRWELQP